MSGKRKGGDSSQGGSAKRQTTAGPAMESKETSEMESKEASEMESKEASEMVRGLEALQALYELEARCTRGTFNMVDAARLLAAAAPKSHKDWAVTEQAGDALAALIAGPDDPMFRSVFKRVLDGGNWHGAVEASAARQLRAIADPATGPAPKPWVVLVTGVNGIRKTTSVHRPWFKQLLARCLKGQYDGPVDALPDGKNSFFRQLDFIIATIAHTEFAELYKIDADVTRYSEVKAGIFTRYRTLAEVTGALLVKAARVKGVNIMVETSGRDMAMLRYIEHFFPDEKYRKLVVHFDVSEIGHAERSVDARMKNEMAKGASVLKLGGAPAEVVGVNAGGPYGSSVLKGVQADSNRVWDQVVAGVEVRVAESFTGQSCIGARRGWMTASISIVASDTEEWYAKPEDAPDLAPGATPEFAFGPLPE